MTDEELLAPLLPDDAAFADDAEHARLSSLLAPLEVRVLDGAATQAESAEYLRLRAALWATGRERALWEGARAFALAAVASACVTGPEPYTCPGDVLEVHGVDVPVQVVECVEDTCDPVTWWTAGDVLVVPCEGGEVLVWW